MDAVITTSKRPGDRCECDSCGGKLRTYSTRLNFALRVRIRYLCCDSCGNCPDGNKWIVPLEFAPRRATSSTA